MSAPAEVEVGRAIGMPVERKEDKKLLQGQAQWVDNMHVPGMVYLGIVRSPYAHARITKVDVTPALAHADVVGAWSGEDIADEYRARFGADALRGRNLDLWTVAERVLRAAGVESVERLDLCTACDPVRFFSHRRDGPITGRQGVIGYVA
jgi:CO/xanthine dehydrogenase Mo-binding subunit